MSADNELSLVTAKSITYSTPCIVPVVLPASIAELIELIELTDANVTPQ